MKNNNKDKGFVLISLLLAVAIIAIMAAMYYGKNGSSSKESMHQTSQKALEQTKENNATQLDQSIEMQNQLNSIGQ